MIFELILYGLLAPSSRSPTHPGAAAVGGLSSQRFRRPVFAGDRIQTVVARSAEGGLEVRLEARGTEDAVVGSVTRAAAALEAALGR